MTESHTPNTQGDSWEKEFDRTCPPVTELLPAEYGEWLADRGWTMASFEMENDARYTRAQLYHENVKKFIRTLLSKERAEGERRERERCIEAVKSKKQDHWHINYEGALKENRDAVKYNQEVGGYINGTLDLAIEAITTLPADSTEEEDDLRYKIMTTEGKCCEKCAVWDGLSGERKTVCTWPGCPCHSTTPDSTEVKCTKTYCKCIEHWGKPNKCVDGDCVCDTHDSTDGV